MDVIKYTNVDNKEWNSYCEKIKITTFNHLSDRIRYDIEYSPYLQKNLSFILLENKKPMGVIPLYIEKIEKSTQISFSNSYGVVPAIAGDVDYNKQEKILKFIFSYIDNLAQENKCSKALFKFDPLANPEGKYRILNFNYLLQYGFTDHSLISRIIDLREEKNILWKNMRRGHRCATKQGLKNFSFEFYNSKNITEKIFDIYRTMHYRAARRATRPLITFKIMYDWINDNNTVLGLGKYKNKYVASILLTKYKNTAYYGSGAEEPSIKLPMPIGHALMWQSICYLKDNSVDFFEIGWQQYGKLPYDEPSKKDLNISLYKRGFGGYNVPLFRGIKNY